MLSGKRTKRMNKFIVFEGLDGAGKSTQIKLLTDYLNKAGVSSKFLHFPRVEEGLIGDMIARFLRGEFGKSEDINPYFVALMYSQDRNNAKEMLRGYINDYDYLIVDRFVYSNIAFQCAKVSDKLEKEALRDWILKLEFTENALPKPDMTMYLKMPFDFIENTLTKGRKGEDRSYLKGNTDIHEDDLNLQRNVDIEYLKMAEIDDRLKVVDCQDKDGKLLEPEAINANIIRLIAML